jgi:hypothetical protein
MPLMRNTRRAQARSYRPYLESLESREVASAVPWTPLPPSFATVPALRADRFDPGSASPQVVVTGAVRHDTAVPAVCWAGTWTEARPQGPSSVLATLQRGLSHFLDGLDAAGQRVADSPLVGGTLTWSLATTAMATALEVGRRQTQPAREEERTGIWGDAESWLCDPLPAAL